MFIINSKKLIIIFSLIISCPMLFPGCVGTGEGPVPYCCLPFVDRPGQKGLLSEFKEFKHKTDDKKYIHQIDSFSLCTDQKKDCVEYGDKISHDPRIAIKMPYGTNVKKLVAYFKYQGAKVYVGETQQISGKTVNDFTYPVIYRVQSGSGDSGNYYVKVITAPEKTMCAFYLTGCRYASRLYGVIDQNAKTISVMLPSRIVNKCGSSGIKLKANFIYFGSSVFVGKTKQISGETENDFSSPVVYTVQAKDGSSVNYSVSVTATNIPQNSIYEFIMIDPSYDPARTQCNELYDDYCSTPLNTAYRGHIDQKNKLITVNLPVRDGIDVKKLTAQFKFLGYSVFVGRYRQTSEKTANDFSSPVVYRVQGVEYTVKVNTIPEKTISEFFLSECFDYCEKYYGVIDEKTKTISVVLPDDKQGKALSSLKANFTYSGSSVVVDKTKQISGITENDFSSPVVYTVKAKDGSSADYAVTVTFPTEAQKI